MTDVRPTGPSTRPPPGPIQPLHSPICAALRSKKYAFLKSAPMEPKDVLDASNDCWCDSTCDRLGPDGGGVHPDDCREGRRCFRPIFSRPQA